MASSILAKRHLSTLADFAFSNVLLGFDYDGTLAPIAATPDRARMRARTKRLLTDVAKRYPCVIISGRPLSDLVQRLDHVPAWAIFGNHGAEPWARSEPHASRVRRWVAALRVELAGEPGVVVEDKQYSASVHYRHARRKQHVRAVVKSVLARARGVRIIDCSQAVNIIPSTAVHKGTVLQRARRVLACDTAIYVGDDSTDEDAFRSADSDRLLGIRIGPAGSSVARYRLASQSDIDSLLRRLLAFRSRRRHL